jgi:hypothetical protein
LHPPSSWAAAASPLSSFLGPRLSPSLAARGASSHNLRQMSFIRRLNTNGWSRDAATRLRPCCSFALRVGVAFPPPSLPALRRDSSQQMIPIRANEPSSFFLPRKPVHMLASSLRPRRPNPLLNKHGSGTSGGHTLHSIASPPRNRFLQPWLLVPASWFCFLALFVLCRRPWRCW